MTWWQWNWTEVDGFRRCLEGKNDIGDMSDPFLKAALFRNQYVSLQGQGLRIFDFFLFSVPESFLLELCAETLGMLLPISFF